MNRAQMSTTECAAELRQTLKAHKMSSRRVSVRSKSGSLQVTINDPMVSFQRVSELSREYARIHRCEYTGDILSGGNRFVTVQYGRDAQQALIATYKPAVEQAERLIVGNSLVPVAQTPFLLGRSMPGLLTIWDAERFHAQAFSVEDVALWIGRELSSRHQ